jgi:hypothetical protein
MNCAVSHRITDGKVSVTAVDTAAALCVTDRLITRELLLFRQSSYMESARALEREDGAGATDVS